ncbi:TolC family protein [Massilia sp. DWR3-1-1]|uniref:TolC family protein n=1 Tax=Massilia sp. DWR3-1-1 TaxID=2804559 RepID=UPI003CF7BBB2
MSARRWLLVLGFGLGGMHAVPASASGALSALPPEPVVRRVLENLPQFRLGMAAIDLADAEQAKLQAGPYEWTVRSSVSRRSVAPDARYAEQDLALERTMRWFGKAERDRAVGEKGREVAHARHADMWHEAGRALLTDWFAALRDSAAVERLQEQLQVARQLHEVAATRVKAGDGAALEQRQAATEVLRVEALLLQARQLQDQSQALLDNHYPGLPAPVPGRLPAPQPDEQANGYWLAKIVNDNHEVELAQAEADLAALRASRVASDRMPDPTFAVRAARERGGEERVLGLTISIAIPGPGRSADAAAAAIKARAAVQLLAQARTRVQSMASRAVIDSTRSYQVWDSLREIEAQTAQQAQLLQRAYQGGEGSLADALAARRRALEAALLAQAARIDALAAFARVRLDAHLIWSID